MPKHPWLIFVLGCGAHNEPSSAPAALPISTPIASHATLTANAPDGSTHAAPEVCVLEGGANTRGEHVAIDAKGNMYLVGSYDGSLRLGDLPPLSSEDSDAFDAALDASGRPTWSHRIGGRGLDYGNDVAVDATGVYVSGAFESSSIDLGSGPLRNAGIHDLFLAKYDFSGKLLWAKRYGDALDQISLHLRAHPQGGVVATGWFNGTLDFGAGPVSRPFVRSSFVARIDESGRGKWSRAFGHRFDYGETDAAIDSHGHVFVSGGSDGTSEFVVGGHPATKNDLGPVLLELDPAGAIVSATRFGEGTDNVTTAVAFAPDGSFRFGSASRGVVDFGSGPKRPVGYEEAVDTRRFDSGEPRWSTRVFTGRIAEIAAVVVDARGKTYAIGNVMRHESRGGPFGRETNRGIITTLDPNGAIDDTFVLDDAGSSELSGAAIATDGRVVASGTIGYAIVVVTLPQPP
jgi:hypothetical protein